MAEEPEQVLPEQRVSAALRVEEVRVDEAVENQSEAVTEYLNAQERRVIHVALRDDGRVKTYALGSGMIKRLAVAPADFPGAPEEGE